MTEQILVINQGKHGGKLKECFVSQWLIAECASLDINGPPQNLELQFQDIDEEKKKCIVC